MILRRFLKHKSERQPFSLLVVFFIKIFLSVILLVGITPLFAANQTDETNGQVILWEDLTDELLSTTTEWTNRVELADINGDGRVDLLFANGGNYAEPGEPELNRIFLNKGPNMPFEEVTMKVVGTQPDYARVIKVRDINADGLPDILVGTTFQTQSRLYLGSAKGTFQEVTDTHLPHIMASVGDMEVGDVDGDGDLDLVLAEWGKGNHTTNAGGRTMLWLNDGNGYFKDVTDTQMPDILVQFSWDLEFIDFDNDYDLDIVVSCSRCDGDSLFINDGSGSYKKLSEGLPQYTNNHDFETMDIDGDGFLDLVTINDGEIVGGQRFHWRQHIFKNIDGTRFIDATDAYWPDSENIGEDDNTVTFLDYDSDGDADFLISSLTGSDRLLINDGEGHFKLMQDVFTGPPTPGTLSLVVADLDGDHRLDVVQGQGEQGLYHERIYLGKGLAPDTAPPIISLVESATISKSSDIVRIRARVHDNKSPTMPFDWSSVSVEWGKENEYKEVPMSWYGEYLWRADFKPGDMRNFSYRVCATDVAGNGTCSQFEKIHSE